MRYAAALVFCLGLSCAPSYVGRECTLPSNEDPELVQAIETLERLALLRSSPGALAAVAMAYTCAGRTYDAQRAVARARDRGPDARLTAALADVEHRLATPRRADPLFRKRVLETARRLAEADEALRAGTVDEGE